ncbi:MAG: type VI secretion system contractile sheath large subunit, partial [Zoogloea sp.]|nr:type VI secretion system contractile sheath large subunit [Zoogloea sp.]
MSAQLETEFQGAVPGTEAVSLLDQIVEQSRVAVTDNERSTTRGQIAELVEEVLAGTVKVSRDLAASIDLRIAQLDELLSAQLNAIMHHPEFQKLEASWRGLKYLVANSETSPMLKIKMLNASKKDLVKDFKSAPDFDQSALFKKIYEEEYGTFGGAPYASLIGDYEFSRHPEDFYLLDELSHVAAAAHAPLIAAAAPSLFGLESFNDIGKPRDLSKIFETAEYAKWKSFRESEDARYVGLVLPHVLGRLPYGRETVPVEEFNFEEDVDGSEHAKYLWANASYAFGTRLTDAFAKYGWLAAIRGVEG